MKTNLFLCALTLCLLAAPALADSWLPYQDKRVVSPTGKTYVVLKQEKGGVAWELCRRAEGAEPLRNATAQDSYGIREGSGGSIDRDPADMVIGTGHVDQRPLRVRVLDKPEAFILFEKYGNVGHGDSLIYVDGRQGVIFRRKLNELFDAEICGTFKESVSSIWWHQGIAVDEDGKNILVVAVGDRLSQVEIGKGLVTRPEKEVLLRGFRRGTTEERELCLETAARLKPEGLHAEALAIASDEGESVPIRMRAAVAVSRAGGREDFSSLLINGTAKDQPGEIRSYAVSNLGEVAGADALPSLRRLMRGEADNDVWLPAQAAFVSLGKKAVPTLIEMLLEEGETSDYRGGAAHALGKIGSPASIDALLTATATADEYVANAAVNAAIKIGSPDLARRLAEILANGSTQDGRIAMYFEKHPAELAREALQKALKRAEPESSNERRIKSALKAL